MNSNLKLLPAALLVAMLAVAGCGGGGSDDTTEPVDPPTMPTEPTGPTPDELASAEIKKSKDAMEAADTAFASAKDAHEGLGTIGTMGSSELQQQRAQAILDAKVAIMTQSGIAKAAYEALKMQHDGASDDRKAVLADDVAAAKKVYEDIMAMLARNGMLARWVTTVEGNDMTPAKHAAAVAKAVGDYLNGITDRSTINTSGLMVTTDEAAIATQGIYLADGGMRKAVFGHGHTRDDTMMTFAEIYEGSIVSNPVGDALVEMVSLDGKTANADGGATESVLDDTAITNAKGSTTAVPYIHEGISGNVYCRGDADKCVVESGKLSGDWFFAPADKNAYHAWDPETQRFAQALFAEYGLWLYDSSADEGVQLALARRVGVGRGSVATATIGGLNYDADEGDTETKATYMGNAAGLSTIRAVDPLDGTSKVTSSGAFTADVELTATFRASSPTLSGMIDNFQGDATDAGWEVKLGAIADISSGTGRGAIEDQFTGTDATNSGWSATAYGSGTGRPKGFYGDFDSRFANGEVSGVYAAE